MNEEQFAEVLARGHEQSGVEFKGPACRTDKLAFANLVRAVLGMSNRRDGGYVVIGVEETGGKPIPTGLSTEDLATWLYDKVADGIAAYAEPSVVFDLQTLGYQDKNFVILKVEEFSEVPAVCRKTYQTKIGKVILREGACYVRPRRKPETVEVSTYADMRDLIDLAVDKNTRRFVQRAYAAGLRFEAQPAPTDEALFAKQRDTFA